MKYFILIPVFLSFFVISISRAEDVQPKWVFPTGGLIESSPAIDSDGTVYVGSEDDNLYAINPDGTLKWKYKAEGDIRSSPAIGSDGTIYIGCKDKSLYAIDTEGKLKWKFPTNGEIYSSPSIGSDGTIYVGSDDYNLYAINSNGNFKWNYPTGRVIRKAPTIGSDGTVYAGSNDKKLYAIDSEGHRKWDRDTKGVIFSSPTLGNDGTIYFVSWDMVENTNSYLYALSTGNAVRWKYHTDKSFTSSPTIGNDGTVYIGNLNKYLYAINSEGKPKWTYETGDIIYSSPAIGSDGTIYVGSDDDNLYAINPDGTLKWKCKTGGNIRSSPAIGNDGTVYVGSADGNLYAIETDSFGYQQCSPWPCYGRNNKHISRAFPLLMSINTSVDEVKVSEHNYKVNLYLKNNIPNNVDIISYTCSDSCVTCSLTFPFSIMHGQTITATFGITGSGLYEPVFTLETYDNAASVKAPKQLYIVAPAGSELEHDILKAKSAWETCKEADSNSIATRNNYGVLLRYAEEYELASEYLLDTESDANKKHYGTSGIKMNIGVVHSDINDPNFAMDVYEDALSVINDINASVLATKLFFDEAWEDYNEGNFETAEALLNQIVDHNKADNYLKAKAYVLRGSIYYNKGDLIAANSDFENAIFYDPGGPIGRMALANKGEPFGVEVYQFWSATYGWHFYTIDEFEKDILLHDTEGQWIDQGVAFYAFADDREPNVVPVYRLYSESHNEFFYTINESERDELITDVNDISAQWMYEKVAFYVFSDGGQPSDTHPVYCFSSNVLGTNYYTKDENEKNMLINDSSDIWTYLGIAWYVYE